ncbi:MAG: dimethyl sulfoxide reductase anchor subunit [Rhodobacteraceae bacterium]|jgi:DMSO reductase anchor subunit|nr:dimethyl sulfoxide reductase anchor subunit [Paracoccaceae bacterium]
MHPAVSIILFTVLSGAGFGLLALLGTGAAGRPAGWAAFVPFALGLGLAGAGLVASAFHLGRPERALRAFTQWRTSWLSREAVLAAATFAVVVPNAAASVLLARPLPGLGWAGAVLAVATVGSTAMIYAQMRTVPRWRHWTTLAVFLAAAAAGGTLLAGLRWPALAALGLLGIALAAHWRAGDRPLGRAGQDAGTATGLGALGRVRPLSPAHTGGSYVLKEMVHVVGRRHARRLRLLAFLLAVVLPAALVAPGWGGWLAFAIAAPLHLGGMLAARWLFFAEAEHVVGLYYGRG